MNGTGPSEEHSMNKVCLGMAFVSVVALFSYACAVGNGDPEASPIEEIPGVAEDAGKRTGLPPSSDARNDSTTNEDDGGEAHVDAGPQPGDAGDAGKDATAPLDDAGTFMVVRVGTAGGATLSAAAAAVHLEERRFTDGVVTQTISLPTAAAGAERPFALRGTATTEGALSLAGNGAYVVLAGYAATPGTADVAETASASTPRVVARVTKGGVIDTSTTLDAAFDGKSVRGAATATGASFWVAGENGANASGGIYFIDRGTTGGTQILDAPQNLRVVTVFGGQLYASTQSGAVGNTLRLFSVGAGMPTTAGQVATVLPGTTDANTPHGFTMLDLDPAIAGVDTMYVADTRSLASGGGIQKLKLVAGTWTLAATFKSGLTGAPVNVTAKKSGASVLVVCVTLDNPAKIVRFIDDGVSTSPVGAVLTTGTATSVQFRGIAVSPL
jgi:hypothetical protein